MFEHLIDGFTHYLDIAFYRTLTKNIFLKILKDPRSAFEKRFNLFAGGQHIL